VGDRVRSGRLSGRCPETKLSSVVVSAADGLTTKGEIFFSPRVLRMCKDSRSVMFFSHKLVNYAMNRDYNLPPAQRRVQQLVAVFNADEQLWRCLEGKRRLRRRAFPRLSSKLQKQLDLLDFARARPPQDCLGWTEGR